jgi:tetraacyldisaccharide 4'-kinase
MSIRRPLLLPLVPLYRLALATHDQRLVSGRERVRRLSQPVISIGNLSTGGAGKTPLTIALARALTARGVSVDVLSLGYGRRDRSAARVRTEGAAEQFGDEPLLIARAAGVPVYVAAERFDAGRLAEADAAPASVHILDDGFQHRQLYRDIDILLLNREDWHDRLLPAGNLRETLQAARRASAIAIPEQDTELERELRLWGWAGPVWHLRREMEVPPVTGPVVAFCGIARPDQFFLGLEAAGAKLAAWKVYRDHHRYTPRDLERLREMAANRGVAEVLTTKKDAVRMGALASALPLKTVGLRVEIEAAALDWLIERIQQSARKPAL